MDAVDEVDGRHGDRAGEFSLLSLRVISFRVVVLYEIQIHIGGGAHVYYE